MPAWLYSQWIFPGRQNKENLQKKNGKSEGILVFWKSDGFCSVKWKTAGDGKERKSLISRPDGDKKI